MPFLFDAEGLRISTLETRMGCFILDKKGAVSGRNSSTGDQEWRIEKRNLTDGELIWTQTQNPSPGEDTAYGVVIDSSGMYIVGLDSSIGNGQWRMEKRSLTTVNPTENPTFITPSPTIPEFPQTILLFVFAAVSIVIAVGLVAYRRRNPHNSAILK